MAHGHEGASEFGKHARGNLAGIGPGRILRDVLRAIEQFVLVTFNKRLHRSDISERWQHRNLDCCEISLVERESQLLYQSNRLEVVKVHLPVAGHERLAGGRLAVSACHGSVLPENGEARKGLPFEEFKAGATTGTNVTEIGFVKPE